MTAAEGRRPSDDRGRKIRVGSRARCSPAVPANWSRSIWPRWAGLPSIAVRATAGHGRPVVGTGRPHARVRWASAARARLGDLLGRRRVFVFGLAVFVTASFLIGLAPPALSPLTASFPDGFARTIASSAGLRFR